MREIVRAEDLRSLHSSKSVLIEGNLVLYQGEAHGLTGLSDSGKTALLQIIAGITAHESGRLYFRGDRVTERNRRQLLRQVVYLEADGGIVDELSVADNACVLKPCRPGDFVVSKRRIRRQCAEILEFAGIRAEPGSPCRMLEDSEKQRLAITKAVLGGGRLILLNCPGLVYTDGELLKLEELVRRTCADGVSYVFVNSSLAHMQLLCDRITILKDGVTARSLTRKQYRPPLIAAALTGSRGETGSGLSAPRTSPVSQPVLELQGVSCGLLQNVSFCVRRGEIAGILSPSVRWNRNLMRVLQGREPALAGTVLRNGEAASRAVLSDRGTANNKICFLHESNFADELFPNMTVEQNYLFLAQQKVSAYGYLPKKLRSYRPDSPAEGCGLPPELLRKPFDSLSHLELYQLFMSRTRLFHPDLAVFQNTLDDSDLLLKNRLVGDLRRLADDGVGILLLGAGYHDLAKVCDTVLVMEDGAVRPAST